MTLLPSTRTSRMALVLRSSQRRLISGLRRSFSTSCVSCAGHNKWSKIKDKKGANDLQKSLLYSKASHEIITAARSGGSTDPAMNLHLASALRRAKELGVPKENIEKALGRAAGGKEGSGNRLVYEALAFDSVGLMIECYTDNVNRTLHNIRDIISSRGARMAPVKFMFERYGRVSVSITDSHEVDLVNRILDIGIECGASEVKQSNIGATLAFEFFCQPEILGQLEGGIREDIEDLPQASIVSAELVYVPREAQTLEDEEKQILEDLVEALEADNDTHKVYTSVQS